MVKWLCGVQFSNLETVSVASCPAVFVLGKLQRTFHSTPPNLHFRHTLDIGSSSHRHTPPPPLKHCLLTKQRLLVYICKCASAIPVQRPVGLPTHVPFLSCSLSVYYSIRGCSLCNRRGLQGAQNCRPSGSPREERGRSIHAKRGWSAASTHIF